MQQLDLPTFASRWVENVGLLVFSLLITSQQSRFQRRQACMGKYAKACSPPPSCLFVLPSRIPLTLPRKEGWAKGLTGNGSSVVDSDLRHEIAQRVKEGPGRPITHVEGMTWNRGRRSLYPECNDGLHEYPFGDEDATGGCVAPKDGTALRDTGRGRGRMSSRLAFALRNLSEGGWEGQLWRIQRIPRFLFLAPNSISIVPYCMDLSWPSRVGALHQDDDIASSRGPSATTSIWPSGRS